MAENVLDLHLVWNCLDNCWSRSYLFVLEMLNDEQRSVYTCLCICVLVPCGSCDFFFFFKMKSVTQMKDQLFQGCCIPFFIYIMDYMRCKQSFDVIPHAHVSTASFARAGREKKNDTRNIFCMAEEKPGGTSAFHNNELLSCLLVAKLLLRPKTAVAITFLKPRSESKEITKSPQTVLQCGYQMVSLKSFEEPSHIPG